MVKIIIIIIIVRQNTLLLTLNFFVVSFIFKHLIESNCIFKELRNSNEPVEGCPRLDLDSYVDVVRDVLKMRKNLCICRKFDTLNKDVIRQKTTPVYIDVWPV